MLATYFPVKSFAWYNSQFNDSHKGKKMAAIQIYTFECSFAVCAPQASHRSNHRTAYLLPSKFLPQWAPTILNNGPDVAFPRLEHADGYSSTKPIQNKIANENHKNTFSNITTKLCPRPSLKLTFTIVKLSGTSSCTQKKGRFIHFV